MNVTQIVQHIQTRSGNYSRTAGEVADDLRISYSAAKYWLDKATAQGKLERKCFKPCHCFQRHYYVVKEQELINHAQ